MHPLSSKSNEAGPSSEAGPSYNSGPALRSFLHERGFSIRKQWGQNFLINPEARRTIVDALETEKGASIWEIGSGLGNMTCELLQRGYKVQAFELDPGLCSILDELFASNSNFTLIPGDVLKTWKTAERAPYLLGNLPYNIAAMLIGTLITEQCFFSRMIITVQKEVALRMTAAPGSKDYSSISVLCASAYKAKIIMTLKGKSFYPVPHVDSSVIRFDRLPVQVPPLFYPLLRALFSSRRKTLSNNLQKFLANSCTLKAGKSAELAITVLKECGLSGRERAEMLGPETFFALAGELEKHVPGKQVVKEEK